MANSDINQEMQRSKNRMAVKKIRGWPIQAFCWLEWGSSGPGQAAPLLAHVFLPTLSFQLVPHIRWHAAESYSIPIFRLHAQTTPHGIVVDMA